MEQPFWKDVAAYLNEHAVSQSSGINWTWAAFESEAAAKDFLATFPTLDHRGVYPPGKGESVWSVRYR